MLRALPFLALMIIALPFSVFAQETAEFGDKTTPAFTCSARTEGQLTCQANKQCACGHRPADAAAGLPARWAWDCGIMRPRCTATPADTSGEGGYPLPPVIVDQSGKRDHGGD